MLRALQIAAVLCVVAWMVDRGTSPAHLPPTSGIAVVCGQTSDATFTAADRHSSRSTLLRLDERNQNAWAIAYQQVQTRSARTTNDRVAGSFGMAHDTRRARSSAARRHEPLPDSPPCCHALGLSARGLRLKN